MGKIESQYSRIHEDGHVESVESSKEDGQAEVRRESFSLPNGVSVATKREYDDSRVNAAREKLEKAQRKA